MKRFVSIILAVVLTAALLPLSVAGAETAGFTPITGREMMEKLGLGLNLFGEFNNSRMPDEWPEGFQNTDAEYFDQAYNKATPEYFKAIAMKGYNFVSFNISWQPHQDENYKINEEWLDRVEQVINWAVDAGLYVSMAPHLSIAPYAPHTGLNITPVSVEECFRYIAITWGQLADRFKYHSEHVIFEMANEPWGFYENTEFDIIALNELNASMLKVVRESGGYNDKRIVFLPTRGGWTGEAELDGYAFPDDPYCMADVHDYCYAYSHNMRGITFETGGEIEILDMYDRLDEFFLSKNIPFIMGETGPAINEMELSERLKWVECYIAKAKEIGMPVAITVAEETISPLTLIWGDADYRMSTDGTRYPIAEPEYINAIFEAYGKTPGKNFLKRLTYEDTFEFGLGRILPWNDAGSWYFESFNGLPHPHAFEVTDALVFELKSSIHDSLGDDFNIAFDTVSVTDREYDLRYPDSPRLSIDGNKLIYDIEGLLPAFHIEIQSTLPDWINSLTRVYLEKHFDPTYSDRALAYIKTALANDLIPDELMTSFSKNATRGEFAAMLEPLIKRLVWPYESQAVSNANASLTVNDAAAMLTEAAELVNYTGAITALLPTSGTVTREDCIIAIVQVFEALCAIDAGEAYAPNLDTASAWSQTTITTAVQTGIVPETLQNNYQASCTRAEFCALAVALIEKLTGTPITASKTFDDDNGDINICKIGGLEIVTGTGGNNFSPNDPIKRADAAVILEKVARKGLNRTLPEGQAALGDMNLLPYAEKAIRQMRGVSPGIMSGKDGNRFDPSGNFSREECISTMLKLWNWVNS